AVKNGAQVDRHGLVLFRRAEELDLFELAFEIFEERQELLARRRLGLLRHRERQRPAACELEPLISDDDYCLRQIERCESRIDRQRENAVSECDLVVLQAIALASEQHADALSGRDTRRHLARGRLRADDWLGL